MQKLDPDLLSLITVYLPDESIGELTTSSTLENNIREVKKNNLFWKERTEILLKTYLKHRNINWEQAYKIIVKSIDKENAIVAAIDSRNADVIDILIQMGYDPYVEDNKAIKFASENGHTEEVHL